jgi:CRP-like cAMP-binding protein
VVQADESLPPAPRNRLLAALPPEQFAWLWPRLEPIELLAHRTLHSQGDPLHAVYFPEAGWVSLLVRLEDGDSAEVGVVGREGLVGLPLMLGGADAELDALVQGPGQALRLGAAAFHTAMDDSPVFRRLMLRYALARHVHSTRTAACNARHRLDQRLARSLLMAHDRADGCFPITHETLSMMLGVRRAGVTVAAGALQKAGLIRYGAGQITITDRPGLEAFTCECYAAIQQASGRLLCSAAAAAAKDGD